MNTLELPPSWPDTAPTPILPGLWQGVTSESSHLGMPTKAEHYRGEQPFDLIVTRYADAQSAPWGSRTFGMGSQMRRLTRMNGSAASRRSLHVDGRPGIGSLFAERRV